MPKAYQNPCSLPPTDSMYRLGGLPAILWLIDQPRPCRRRIAELREIEGHRLSFSFAEPDRESTLGAFQYRPLIALENHSMWRAAETSEVLPRDSSLRKSSASTSRLATRAGRSSLVQQWLGFPFTTERPDPIKSVGQLSPTGGPCAPYQNLVVRTSAELRFEAIKMSLNNVTHAVFAA